MAWTTQNYCSRTDVKVALDPQMSGADDAFIDGLIVQAQADLDSEIGFAFQQDGTAGSPATRIFDGQDVEWLWVESLVAPASTTVGAVFETNQTTYLSPGGFWISGAATVTDITADILWKPNNYASLGVAIHKLVRRSGLVFLSGQQNYRVLGIWGRPIIPGQTYPGVPSDVTRACIRLAIHYYKQRDTAYSDLVTEQGGIRERYVADWPADVMRVVAKYQHRRFMTYEY